VDAVVSGWFAMKGSPSGTIAFSVLQRFWLVDGDSDGGDSGLHSFLYAHFFQQMQLQEK
jgi:hypothetical protein